jgi:hypothetical protein
MAQTGFAKGTPVRLGDTGSIPFTQKRPVVDVDGIASKAANEVITVLAEQELPQAAAAKARN